jgi:phosphatidylglycerophosphatase A
MTPSQPSAAQPRSFLARFAATVGGLGYLPLMPGTFGSLAGVALYALTMLCSSNWGAGHWGTTQWNAAFWNGPGATGRAAGLWIAAAVTVIISALGVWAAGREERASGRKDPQHVVIDEVSGQLITFVAALSPLNWKYCLAGFILFRGFDIAKPFPIRQAESLPGGWGIMADDWLAGLFAALGLWILRWAGM